MKTTIKAPRFIDIAIRVFITIGILILIPFGGTYVANGFDLHKANFFGYNTYRTCGDSMLPILKDNRVITKRVPPEELKIGDVIVFHKKYVETDEVVGVVHRIIDKIDGGFVTEGDNNIFHDGWIIYPEDIAGKVLYKIDNLKVVPVDNKVIHHNYNLDFYFCEDETGYPYDLIEVRVYERHCKSDYNDNIFHVSYSD